MRKHRIFLLNRTKDRNNHAGRSSKSLVSHVMLQLIQFILFCLLCFQSILNVKPFTKEENEVRDQCWMKLLLLLFVSFNKSSSFFNLLLHYVFTVSFASEIK
jgi:hypothetical protein